MWNWWWWRKLWTRIFTTSHNKGAGAKYSPPKSIVSALQALHYAKKLFNKVKQRECSSSSQTRKTTKTNFFSRPFAQPAEQQQVVRLPSAWHLAPSCLKLSLWVCFQRRPGHTALHLQRGDSDSIQMAILNCCPQYP